MDCGINATLATDAVLFSGNSAVTFTSLSDSLESTWEVIRREDVISILVFLVFFVFMVAMSVAIVLDVARGAISVVGVVLLEVMVAKASLLTRPVAGRPPTVMVFP